MRREWPDLIQRKADPVNLGATLITTMHSCHSLGSLLGIKGSHHTSAHSVSEVPLIYRDTGTGNWLIFPHFESSRVVNSGWPVCVPCDCGGTKDSEGGG